MFSPAFKAPLLLSTGLALVSLAPAFAQEAPPEEDDRTLETVVVRGQFIPEPQRETSQVASFLSSQDLARQGDANAALALSRLSGLSVVDGKFAYVRGLGDRYSAALLNGSALPSPEPLRRTVPLDLFPSGVLDGAVVQKTYSADLPGEFGGGLIDLRTLRRPLAPFVKVKIGSGYNTESTLSSGLLVRGSESDWSGYDDGLRDLPAPLARLATSGVSLNALSPAEIEAAGESLVNGPLSVIQRQDMDPGFESSVEGGTVFDYGDFDIGLIGVAGYEQGWTTELARRQFVEGGVVGSDLDVTETTFNATVNALGSVSVGFGEQEVSATVFYVHDTSKEAQISTGFDFNEGADVFDESSGWFERELTYLQLAGEHVFGDFEASWRGSFSESTRNAPYERSLRRFIDEESGLPVYNKTGNYRLRFSDLTDQVEGFGGDLVYRFDISPFREATLSAGFDYANTERAYNALSLRFIGGNTSLPEVEGLRPDFLFSPDNIDPARFVLQEVTTPNDSYGAQLEVNAAYVQVEADLTDYIQATLGVRQEDANEQVQTFDRFGNLGAGAVNLNNKYVLPSATLTWNFLDDLQLRLAYSETIARPQFRELALSSYIDPQTDRVYRGNSELIDSELTNYDVRLEYYMGRNQFVTGAVFFKEIENPIEEYQFSTSTFVFETTFINSPKAELLGGELEYRTRFDMPFEGDFWQDRDWLFSANYTYTQSEIVAAPTDLIFEPVTGQFITADLFGIDGAALQGTPKNILNLQFGWESDVEQLTLLLGWVDKRILQRGIPLPGRELPDVIEDPGVQLDLVYRRDFVLRDRDVTLGLSARNLLNEANEEFQENGGALGRTEFNTYERGMSISASLTAKF